MRSRQLTHRFTHAGDDASSRRLRSRWRAEHRAHDFRGGFGLDRPRNGAGGSRKARRCARGIAPSRKRLQRRASAVPLLKDPRRCPRFPKILPTSRLAGRDTEGGSLAIPPSQAQVLDPVSSPRHARDVRASTVEAPDNRKLRLPKRNGPAAPGGDRAVEQRRPVASGPSADLQAYPARGREAAEEQGMTDIIENTAAETRGAHQRRSRAFQGFGRVKRWRSLAEAVHAHERAFGRSARRTRPATLRFAARPRARHARAKAPRAPRTIAATADAGPTPGPSPYRSASREVLA